MNPKQAQEKTDSFGKQIGYEASIKNPVKLGDAIWFQQI
jgi:hypothetical protein